MKYDFKRKGKKQKDDKGYGEDIMDFERRKFR